MSVDRSRVAVLFIVAALLNFPWEVAQMPLYVNEGTWLEFATHCIVPALGDGIIVLMIYGLGMVILRQPTWADRPGWTGYVLMLMAGFVIAVGIEWGAMHVLERWRYTTRMPRLPGLEIGVAPILQMLVLPPLAFKLTALWLNRNRRASRKMS